MTDDKKHYELKAETGHFRIISGSANPIANSAIIAVNSITSFGHDFVVVPPRAKSEAPATEGRTRTLDAAYDPTKIPGAIVVSSGFTLVFGTIVAITLLGFIAEIIMAIVWGDPLSTLQERVSSSADWAFKGGLGVIFGLLVGKEGHK